jgi:LysM repeat protein
MSGFREEKIMTRAQKVVFGILIALVALFAGGTGYFYSKSNSLSKTDNATDTKKTTSTSTEPIVAETPVTTPTTSAVSTPAALNNRPSSPSDTVIVGAGETLYAIGVKVGVSWTVLAEVNGIDANKIKAGETIIVPKNNQVSYTVNTEKATALQKEADGGAIAFRLLDTETAKSDSSPVYGLGTADTYTQDKIDLIAGTATVTATKANKKYTITLTQPVTKGAKGIWAITSIKAQ